MYNFEELLSGSGEYGLVTEVRPPLVILSGLANVHIGEIIIFETGEIGEVFTLERDRVQVQIFSPGSVQVGTRATRTNKTIGVSVGKELLGMIVNPLGDSKSQEQQYIRPQTEQEIDVPAPGLVKRAKITKPFSTGTAVIDMMIPLGCGQKQLVIGDRKTGKTSFLLSVIKNQIKLGTIVVYGAISKQKSDIKKIQNFFAKEGLTQNTVIVATESDDSPSLIFLTPYSAMTIGEYFLAQGHNVLVVLDDLSTHAKFYREVSLLANRFPGRDSYPGDIFYTHARLLERAGNFKFEEGERSITVLPVAEIVEGDFTGYIATNLMGMTDGHVYFDSNVYYRGIRPAINISLSVTRVGRQAQNNLTRSINRELTAFLSLYEKMQNLSHFGAELSDTVKQVLSTGEMVYAFFEQQYKVVVALEVQIILFSMLWLKFFEKTDKDSIAQYRDALNTAYQNPSNKQLLDNFMQNSKSFNELLGRIAQYKTQLLAMCNVVTTTDTRATIQQVGEIVQDSAEHPKGTSESTEMQDPVKADKK
ncbi:MAG TPA: F0F1 ATP synthase subunit alpha [Candidatus Levybacteria bacterium]|nr:F0F1 ATP synthase subunit alpha [Candidatus Levybacteria bacterium]